MSSQFDDADFCSNVCNEVHRALDVVGKHERGSNTLEQAVASNTMDM